MELFIKHIFHHDQKNIRINQEIIPQPLLKDAYVLVFRYNYLNLTGAPDKAQEILELPKFSIPNDDETLEVEISEIKTVDLISLDEENNNLAFRPYNLFRVVFKTSKIKSQTCNVMIFKKKLENQDPYVLEDNYIVKYSECHNTKF